jgi:hypothetical protein
MRRPKPEVGECALTLIESAKNGDHQLRVCRNLSKQNCRNIHRHLSRLMDMTVRVDAMLKRGCYAARVFTESRPRRERGRITDFLLVLVYRRAWRRESCKRALRNVSRKTDATAQMPVSAI